ncbi:MAG: hypothetical protein R6V45_09485 [Oceanipulchritudo sp.]
MAPLRYARVLARHNGPIEKIEHSRIHLFGREVYQANAYLSRWLNTEARESRIFSNADGTGTHPSAMVARNMAVSEAIERWALHYLNRMGKTSLYGLSEDSSSNGMSAFPGLFDFQARIRARREAAERFCLVHWWNRDLGSVEIRKEMREVDSIELENPVSSDRVVLTWQRAPEGFFVYGFAAAARLKEAHWKALVEMERSRTALEAFYRENPGFERDDLSTLDNPFERRVVHYSLPHGHREFLARLAARPTRSIHKCSLKPVVDRKVRGPWNRYATVWRVLFPMPRREHLQSYTNFFFW